MTLPKVPTSLKLLFEYTDTKNLKNTHRIISLLSESKIGLCLLGES